ncbi:hypothetical protein DXT76_10820 [Halobacillus trueperi]|uniref:Uncharacterized protein n=1 Tax=Halobacillus trueperi TaxID=156205 RepID=A0A3D8VN51_9BACI|nr:hypothetical protein [Halobacillus trueperi]RDY70869.1 hypothetical protein DXT76_10820 [Halobacillus trueperi]
MTKKRAPVKRYTLKWIGKSCYVYTWKYIKKSKRVKVEQRYKWYSLGPFSLDLLSELENMTLESRRQMELEYSFKWHKREYIESKMNELLLSPPFIERKDQISEISDSSIKEQWIKKLMNDLKQEATECCEETFEGFTPETFRDYLNNGGSIKQLLK